ncbi:Poly(A) polymerase, partial [Phytophthora megakarya]
DEVVSIRTGRALSKTTKWSHPVSWRLSIEDPFELAHDLGRVIFHRQGMELIRSEFKRASQLLSGDHRLEDICVPDETSWNFMATCYICQGRDHVARDCGQLVRQRLTGASHSMAHFSDCWYCGEYGHYKAECPMLFFRDIPRPVEVAKPEDISADATSESGSTPLVGFAPASPPIAIPASPAPKTISPRVNKERPWERGLSPSSSPMLRLSRKKKRARHGSTSSACSTSPSSSLPYSGLSQSEKRQQQQRYQQQRQEQRRRNFTLLEPTRKCGSNARPNKSYIGKVLCPS